MAKRVLNHVYDAPALDRARARGPRLRPAAHDRRLRGGRRGVRREAPAALRRAPNCRFRPRPFVIGTKHPRQGGGHAVHVPDLRRRAGLPEHGGGRAERSLRRVRQLHRVDPRERQLRGRRRAAADLDRDDRPHPRRQDARHRRPVRRDEGAARRLLPGRCEGHGRGAGDRRADPVRALRVDRGAPGGRLGGRRPDGLPGGVRARGRDPDPRARRLRPRRGRRPGGVRDRRGALAPRRRPGESRRLDRHHRPQPRDRPAAPRVEAADARAARRPSSRERRRTT